MKAKLFILSTLALYLTSLSLVASDHLSTEQVIEKYMLAQGGSDIIKNTHSIQAIGIFTSKGEVFHLTLIKKNENKALAILKINGKKLTQAYNGKEAWTSDGTNFPNRINKDNLGTFVRDAPIFSHLAYAKNKGYKTTLMGNKYVDEHNCYLIRLTLPSGETLEYFIDTDSFLERKIVYEKRNGELATTAFKDYKKIGSMTQPYRIENYLNNELSSVVEIETISLNIGIPDQFFDFPKNRENQNSKT